jgi:metal-responsive CopG/Arc/MetJ family transcriptional regulator
MSHRRDRIHEEEGSPDSREPGGRTQRVTVSLPAELVDLLHRESDRSHSTVSGVVREAVGEYFTDRTPTDLPGFVGMVEHPDTCLSERVEELIEEDFRAEPSAGG